MSDAATMTSPVLKQMRRAWLKGTILWHTGLYLLVIAFIMEFVVLGTTEFIVGQTPIAINTLPLYTSVHRTYGMWRSCYDLRGLEIPDSMEVPGCVRPKNECEEINSLFQLNQAFGILGIFFTFVAIFVQINGIARRGSCYITMMVSMVLGFFAMGFTLTIWAVVTSLKRNEFCSDASPVLPQIARSDYTYGASFTIAVIDWIVLVFYLINQGILMAVIRSHAKPITEHVHPSVEKKVIA